MPNLAGNIYYLINVMQDIVLIFLFDEDKGRSDFVYNLFCLDNFDMK